MIRVDNYEAAVYEVQKQLRILFRSMDELQYQIIPNGIYDRQTRANVVSYQKGAGLNPTGVVDLITWQRLFAEPTMEL
ncbi:MAG: peptidoglycan-binding protein [Clostridiales bacterium]|nr:peptidoglycan-binding protein [Clostridiales bacterium]